MITPQELKDKLELLCHPSLPGIQLGLERMHALLAALGDPQKRFPPVVHVAGTNGKGSLLAFLRAIAQANGLNVHRYISPQLLRFHERILLSGKEIGDEALNSLLDHVLPLLKKHPCTPFEAITALAFLAFGEQKAELLLMETGLGGRLDATNVLDKPILTAITPIAMDHAEFLGDSIEKIAVEKAGILKQGIPCVVGKQLPQAMQVIEQAAHKLQSPLFRYGKEWRVEGGYYVSKNLRVKLSPLSLEGAHQMDNAATAIACAEQLQGFWFSPETIAAGLNSAEWPARLQRITDPEWLKLLPPKSELWLDGGHNLHAAEALAQWAASRPDNKPLCLLVGMQRTKDLNGFLKWLAPHTQALTAISLEGNPMYAPHEILEAAKASGIKDTAEMPTLVQCLQHYARRNEPVRVLACGSLLLAQLFA